MHRIFVAVGCALFVDGALAQTASTGPFVGIPLHLTVGPNTRGPAGTVLPVSATFEKESGFVDVAVAAAPPLSTEPNFTTAALFVSNMAGGMLPPSPFVFRIGSFSSGLNYVFANTSTRLVDMAGRWGGLLFSVSRQTTGAPGSLIEAERMRAGGAAADVFSLILPGSTLPSSMSCFPIAVPQRATDGAQMGFTAMLGSTPEMTDFDPFISLYDDGPSVRSLLPDDPWIYFTLPLSVANHPAVDLWYQRGATPMPTAKHGGTILRTQWMSTAVPPRWSRPEIHLTQLDLGLAPADEIDALAVDEARNVLLFSLKFDPTVPPPVTNSDRQLMIMTWTGSPGDGPVPPASPYKYDAGGGSLVNVADLARSGSSGDVDAVCETDPGNGATPFSHVFVHSCSPASTGSTFPTVMSSSVYRVRPTSNSVTSYAVSVDGLGGVEIPTLLVLVVGVPSPQGAAFPANGFLNSYFVTPSPAGWQTRIFNLARPPGPLPAAIWGQSLDFTWAAFGSSTGVVLSTIGRVRI